MKIAKEQSVLFHTDAVQVIGAVPLEMKQKHRNVDMLSLSSHKFYGPKGTGALYLREGIEIDNYMHGGGQERRKTSRDRKCCRHSRDGKGNQNLQRQILKSTTKKSKK